MHLNMNIPFRIFFSLLFICVLAQNVCAEPIKIGVSLPLTGGAAAYGQDLRNVSVALIELCSREE